MKLCFAAVIVCVGLLIITVRVQAADEPSCEPGTEVGGKKGVEIWCEAKDANGKTFKHGKYLRWYAEGKPKWYQGEYHLNRPIGNWTEWYEDGKKKTELSHTPTGELKGATLWDTMGKKSTVKTFLPKVWGAVPNANLTTDITGQLKNAPSATYQAVIQYANQRLNAMGFEYRMDIQSYPELRSIFHSESQKMNPDLAKAILTVGKTDVILDGGVGLSPGACEQILVPIQIRQISSVSIHVIAGSQVLTIKPEGWMEFEHLKVFNPQTGQAITKLFLPNGSSSQDIIGHSADGKMLYLKFPLGDEASVWWALIKRTQPKVGDKPYLTLAISERSLEFVPSETSLINHPRELYTGAKSDPAYWRYDRFTESGLLIGYNNSCVEDGSIQKAGVGL